MNKNYQKEYMKNYKKKNKLLTCVLANKQYELLAKKSSYYDLTINAYAKQILTKFLNHNHELPLTKDRVDFIKQYIRISRWVASNINQITKKANIEDTIDISILISLLQNYEKEFKAFITKN